jgi:hypothetical protein
MKRIEDLLSELEELIEEREEKEQMLNDETEAGNAEEADCLAIDLKQIQREIEIIKTRIIGWVEVA